MRGLTRSYHQPSARGKRLMKLLDYIARVRLHKVHEHIATGDKIEIAKAVHRRGELIGLEIQVREPHQPFNAWNDPITSPFPLEIFFSQPFRRASKRPLSVEAFRRLVQKHRVDVGSVYDDRPILDVRNHPVQ